MQKLTPSLLLNSQARQAAEFYMTVFPDGVIHTEFAEADEQVVTVSFSILGMRFLAINCGADMAPSPVTSFMITCETQDEIDGYWAKLGDRGEPIQCGWLKDQFGIHWQIVPAILGELTSTGTPAQAAAVMQALMKMQKLEIAGLQAAFDSA